MGWGYLSPVLWSTELRGQATLFMNTAHVLPEGPPYTPGKGDKGRDAMKIKAADLDMSSMSVFAFYKW